VAARHGAGFGGHDAAQVRVMNIVSTKQKAALQRLAAGGDSNATEILKCLDQGIAPPPAAIEWFIEWLRVNARGAA
jgi:hypothetical protein